MKRRLSLILAAAIAAASLTGCNGSNEENSANPLQDLSGSQQSDSDNSGGTESNNVQNDNGTENPGGTDIGQPDNTADIKAPYPDIWDVLPEIDVTPESDFEYEYNSELDGIKITAYTGTSTDIRIPETLDGYPVMAADLGDAKITELIMPESMVKIKFFKYYLKYCNVPKDVNFDNLLGESVFGDAAGNLEAVYLHEGRTEINFNAFLNCKSLKSVTIPDSVYTISDSAFNGCESLTSITIPDSVTVIGGGAFANCKNLTSITIPDSVTEIGICVFDGCENLTSVTYKGKTYTYENIEDLYSAINGR